MKPPQRDGGGELIWRRMLPGRISTELRAGDGLVATVRLRRRARAEAEAMDGRWISSAPASGARASWCGAAESATPIGCFTARWTGAGSLEMVGEMHYHWGASNPWHSQWTWHDAEGAAIMQLACGRSAGSGAAGRITIEPQATVLSHLSLLATLGCYLVLLQRQDAEDSTATVIAVI